MYAIFSASMAFLTAAVPSIYNPLPFSTVVVILSPVFTAVSLMSFLSSLPDFGASRSATPAPTRPPARKGTRMDCTFLTPRSSFMMNPPSLFETFYQGCHPGPNADLQPGDIRPGGSPEALPSVVRQTPRAFLNDCNRAADLPNTLRHSAHIAGDLVQVFKRAPEFVKRCIQVSLRVLKKIPHPFARTSYALDIGYFKSRIHDKRRHAD